MSKENPVKTTVYYSTLTEYVSSRWQDLIQFFKVEKQLKAFLIKSVPTVADFRTKSLGNLSGGHSFSQNLHLCVRFTAQMEKNIPYLAVLEDG